MEDGHGVLVCAPTGAGKTVVGEFAVHLARAAGRKCFYTTPIKALSNQKYADLVARHGRDAVGLLTGDSTHNHQAPIVVMTTEVLRSMLYARSPLLAGLSHVVMDEVHFLADLERGAVWEEVILHLPVDVRLVSLSATVSNAEEFGAWIARVRGDTTVVVDETRPVPLWQHVMAGGRLFDLFSPTTGAVDDELVRYVEHRQLVESVPAPRARRGRRAIGRPAPATGASRPELVARLESEGLLPAIWFIFSRTGCEEAVQQCLQSALRLTDAGQVARIREIVERHTAALPPDDLETLGYWEWRDGLERGFAAHHAGMIPLFRHAVEELFALGLVRVVFATETLAVGVNMPARTVVLERLTKNTADGPARLTAGEYTQLTGRAGRRGIDVEGHAVVLWGPEVEPATVAGLASTRTYPLRSSFRVSYNMAVNLVARLGADESQALVHRSFAQFQAEHSVSALVGAIGRNAVTLQDMEERLCGRDGGFLEYRDLRERLADRRRQLELSGRKPDSQPKENPQATTMGLDRLRRGDIIAIPVGRRAGLAVVVESDVGSAHPRVLTEAGWAGRLSSADCPGPVRTLGTLRLPRNVDLRRARDRSVMAETLRAAGITAPSRGTTDRVSPGEDPEAAALRRAIRSHPYHLKSDRDELIALAERHRTLQRDTDAMRATVAVATGALTDTFHRVLALLDERDHVVLDAATAAVTVTKHGRRLSRIYCVNDLLVAECLRRGVWTGLSPAELAAVVSCVLYEARREATIACRSPTEAVDAALGATTRLWSELRDAEARHGLPGSPQPDMGLVSALYRWARGGDLASVLRDANSYGRAVSAGDFVRWCRQTIDLLDQVRAAAPSPAVRDGAVDAVRAIRRGVVALDDAFTFPG